jgi:hypothetical protein
VCGFNAAATNEYDMLYEEVLMVYIIVARMKIASTCVDECCV